MATTSRQPRPLLPSSRHTPVKVVLLAFAAALAFLLVPGVPSASAHSYLTASSPADGESLVTAPQQLRLEFSEHVVLESTHIIVTDGAGRAHPVAHLRAEDVSGSPAESEGEGEDDAQASPEDEAAAEAAGVVDTEAPLAVVADLPELPDGAYHVTWETLSSDDLHRTAGGFAFGVNAAVVADSVDGVAETAPDLLDAIGRWLVYGGLALGLGAALVSRILARAPSRPAHERAARLLAMGSVAAFSAAVAAAVAFALELARLSSSAVSISYAARWGAREAALLLLALVLRRGARPVLVVLVGLAASVGTVALGHTGLRGGPTWLVVSSLHLASSVAWFGAVLFLAQLSMRHRRLGFGTEELRTVLRGFFRPAALLVAVVAVTGLYLAGDVVVSVDAVVGTVYGRVLLAKVLLVAAAGLLAATTSRHLHRDLHRNLHPNPIESAAFSIESAVLPIESAAFSIESAPRRSVVGARTVPRRRITLEATGLGIALALAAVLTSGQPAISPTLVDRDGPAPSKILNYTAEGLQETLVIGPNRPGDSVLTLDVFDARRPSPGPVTGVSVALPARSGAAVDPPMAAQRLGAYRWAAGIRLREAGPTPVTVTVHRQGLPATVTTFDWVVAPATAAPATVLSRAPISDVLQLAALGLLVCLLLVALIARRRPSRLRLGSRYPSTSVSRPSPRTTAPDYERQRTPAP